MSRQRPDELSLLIGQVGEEGVGEDIDGALDLCQRRLTQGPGALRPNEPDERLIEGVDAPVDLHVLGLELVEDGVQAGLAAAQVGKTLRSSRVWCPVTILQYAWQ